MYWPVGSRSRYMSSCSGLVKVEPEIKQLIYKYYFEIVFKANYRYKGKILDKHYNDGYDNYDFFFLVFLLVM